MDTRGYSLNKNVVTTLESEHLLTTYSRREGNTTRIIDHAIQLLFSDCLVVVMDHHQMGRDKRMNEYVFDRIMKRLYAEHNEVTRYLVYDRQKCEIQFDWKK